MVNTRIIYFNRDSCNYKTYHAPVLPGGLTEQQYTEILGCLEDGEYFVPEQVGLDDTRNWYYDAEVDQPWWEIAGFEPTSQNPTISHPTAEELVALFEEAKGNWNAQEPF